MAVDWSGDFDQHTPEKIWFDISTEKNVEYVIDKVLLELYNKWDIIAPRPISSLVFKPLFLSIYKEELGNVTSETDEQIVARLNSKIISESVTAYVTYTRLKATYSTRQATPGWDNTILHPTSVGTKRNQLSY